MSDAKFDIAESITALRMNVLSNQGETSTALRGAVEAQAALRAGGRRNVPENTIIPSNLFGYLELLSSRAFEILDEHIEGLKKAGYSEDEIFEITISSAVGEGMARFERTIELLEGDEL